jgi:hypothetical protein
MTFLYDHVWEVLRVSCLHMRLSRLQMGFCAALADRLVRGTKPQKVGFQGRETPLKTNF